MPQSLANIYIHLIFSTKDRHPFLTKEINLDLDAYIATVLANLKCPATLINSVEGHARILFNLTPTVTVAKAVEAIKKSSSKWIETQGSQFEKFARQAGYGAFSVSEFNKRQKIESDFDKTIKRLQG